MPENFKKETVGFETLNQTFSSNRQERTIQPERIESLTSHKKRWAPRINHPEDVHKEKPDWTRTDMNTNFEHIASNFEKIFSWEAMATAASVAFLGSFLLGIEFGIAGGLVVVGTYLLWRGFQTRPSRPDKVPAHKLLQQLEKNK